MGSGRFRHVEEAAPGLRCELRSRNLAPPRTLENWLALSGFCNYTLDASPIQSKVQQSSAAARVVDEVSGAVFEQEVTADLPAANQFLAPRLFMNNGATAAAVAFDCSGVYLETDF